MSDFHCQKCDVPMRSGVATVNGLIRVGDYGYVPTGAAVFVGCMKCPQCGHSKITQGGYQRLVDSALTKI